MANYETLMDLGCGFKLVKGYAKFYIESKDNPNSEITAYEAMNLIALHSILNQTIRLETLMKPDLSQWAPSKLAMEELNPKTIHNSVTKKNYTVKSSNPSCPNLRGMWKDKKKGK